MLKFLCAGIVSAVLSHALPVAAHAAALSVGQPAPALTATTLDGKRIDTRALVGKVVFLTFWATWCEPCRSELPILSDYARTHADQGLVVLGLNLDDGAELANVRRIAAELAFPVAQIGDPHVPGYGRIWHLPVSFVVDREGRLAVNGWNDKDPTWSAERLERDVTPLLHASGVDGR